MMQRVQRSAVVDMGSNSFRLVVYGYEPGRWWKRIDEIREAVRVSAGMGEEARLRPEAMERAVRTAGVFAAFCRAAGIDDVVCLATSAIRDAVNGPDLVSAIEGETGLRVRVISGEEEARYGYLAMVNSTTIDDGFGIEMGGGSIQLVRIVDRRLARAASLPLGAVRVSERFLPGEKASPKGLKAVRREVARALEGIPWFAGGPDTRVVAIGGGVRNLATAAQRRVGGPPVDVGGFKLSAGALQEVADDLASRPASKRGAVPGIKPDRGDVILGGAQVLLALLEGGGFAAAEVSEAGLREGAFFERLLKDRDPPLMHDVRRESVLNLALQFHTDLRHAEHVAALSRSIFDGLVLDGLARYEPGDRDILWAACLLHDIGVAIDYDDHHKHSQYLILNAGLPGWTPREIALLALITRYHRKGEADASILGPLAEPGDPERLAVLSAVVRLAEQFERSRDQSVRGVRVRRVDGGVRIEPEASGDVTVAVWSARRHADALERALGRPVEVAAPAPGSEPATAAAAATAAE
jgi:exopolyphosphatase / guanosine-5'-triphosphate,3'-diphosphate pyrophosphatase